MRSHASVSQELKSLHDELSAGRPDRLASPSPPPHSESASGPTSSSPVLKKESADEEEVLRYLRELVNEATRFFEEAEKNISAHPTESVVGALVAGIVIGRLLGKR